MAARQFIFISGVSQSELGDDTLGHRISGGVPEQTRIVEGRPIAQADYQVQINHGGKINSHTWIVERDHGTITAAVNFMRDHADSIPNPLGPAAGILQETGDDGSIRFMQACTVTGVKCVRWDGQSTIFQYTVRGAAWTDTINAV